MNAIYTTTITAASLTSSEVEAAEVLVAAFFLKLNLLK